MHATIAFAETVRDETDGPDAPYQLEWLNDELEFPSMVSSSRRTRQMSNESVGEAEGEHTWQVVSVQDSDLMLDSSPALLDRSWECVDAGIQRQFATVAERSADLSSSAHEESQTKPTASTTTPGNTDAGRTQESKERDEEEDGDMGTLALDMIEHRKSAGHAGSKGARRKIKRNIKILSFTLPPSVEATSPTNAQGICTRHKHANCRNCKSRAISEYERITRRKSWVLCRTAEKQYKRGRRQPNAAKHEGVESPSTDDFRG